MRTRISIQVCFLMLVIGFLGCGERNIERAIENFDVPDKLTLYSIDDRDPEPVKEPKSDEKFHGYSVLGKIEVTDPNKRKEIISALKEGMAKSDGSMAKCFWPRPAIRVVEKGQTIDYVVCFECLQLHVHEGKESKTKPITHDPQRVFNRHLKQAGVPLAPGMTNDE